MDKYYLGMYDFNVLPGRDGKKGVGMGLDGLPYSFDDEEEYRIWYVDWLQRTLVNAGVLTRNDIETEKSDSRLPSKELKAPGDTADCDQYGLVNGDGRLVDFVAVENIVDAYDAFEDQYGKFEDGTIVINLSCLLGCYIAEGGEAK